jgi:hypothetical protein
MPTRNCAASCRSAPRSQNLRHWIKLALLTAAPLYAHDAITTKLTWTQEISRLVYKHCANCHREGGAAFSLTTYADARPWAKAIRDEVLGRRMPPWGPVKGVGQFRDDPSLSIPEIEMFVAWVEGGAPEGDPALLPAKIPTPKPPILPAPNRTLAVDRILTLKEPLTLTGIHADHAVEVWAKRPSGTIERLLWLKAPSPATPKDFIFLIPIRLPKGTTIQTTAALTLLADSH